MICSPSSILIRSDRAPATGLRTGSLPVSSADHSYDAPEPSRRQNYVLSMHHEVMGPSTSFAMETRTSVDELPGPVTTAPAHCPSQMLVERKPSSRTAGLGGKCIENKRKKASLEKMTMTVTNQTFVMSRDEEPEARDSNRSKHFPHRP